MKNKNTVIIIPAFDPEEDIMLNFMNKLIKKFDNILIINDGSKKEHDDFFKGFEEKGIKVLKNHINYGKGRSIKTALNYILNNYNNIDSIVTADCDGQHDIEDIEKVALCSKKNPNAYVLGVRDFNKDNVPFKSRYGNKITKNVFKIFIGLNISDTQTGLRAMSPSVATKFLATKGERYEYETNTLIECKEKSIPIVEEVIETIYLNDNKSSHFNPFKDSLSIYKLFFKYITSSLSSFIVDIILFSLVLNLLFKNLDNGTIYATVIARIISSIYNFFVNARLVFKNKNKSSIIKYFLLVLIQMMASGLIVNYLFESIFKTNVIFIKIIVDIIIFIVNFIIQREWVFNKKK